MHDLELKPETIPTPQAVHVAAAPLNVPIQPAMQAAQGGGGGGRRRAGGGWGRARRAGRAKGGARFRGVINPRGGEVGAACISGRLGEGSALSGKRCSPLLSVAPARKSAEAAHSQLSSDPPPPLSPPPPRSPRRRCARRRRKRPAHPTGPQPPPPPPAAGRASRPARVRRRSRHKAGAPPGARARVVSRARAPRLAPSHAGEPLCKVEVPFGHFVHCVAALSPPVEV